MHSRGALLGMQKPIGKRDASCATSKRGPFRPRQPSTPPPAHLLNAAPKQLPTKKVQWVLKAMPKRLFSSTAPLAAANWTKKCSPWEWPHRDGSSSSVSPILAPMALCDTKTQSCEGENQGVAEGNQDSAQVAAERGTGT